MSDPESVQRRPDPLIDEIRALRQEISDRFQNDVRKLGEHLRDIEEQWRDRVVAPPRPSSTSRAE